MPNTVVTLRIGEKRLVHANPKDASGNSVDPVSDLQWDNTAPASIGVLPSGTKNLDAWFKSNGVLGTFAASVRGQKAGGALVTHDFSVTVTPGDLDHFEPTQDPPQPLP